MSSETWKIIQEHKRKQENLREILQKRRKKRQGVEPTSCDELEVEQEQDTRGTEERLKEFLQKPHQFPMKSEIVMKEFQQENRDVSLKKIEVVLLKLAAEEIITVRELAQDQNNYEGGGSNVEIISLRNTKAEIEKEEKNKPTKRDSSGVTKTSDTKSKTNVRRKSSKKDKSRTCEDIEELLATKSTKEETTTRVTDEIQQLLSTASTKEITLTEKFRSMGGSQVREFCPHATREECLKHNKLYIDCQKLHFRKILKSHTDETLGDCSFLNTCFHMDTCKYVHYEIDYRGTDLDPRRKLKKEVSLPKFNEDYLSRKMLPPQWINCDIRYLDVSVLGKFSVIMADPPWDIHMELPYGTMQDTEMRALRIQDLSDDGLMFLWVTGRAMELGRELFDCWGYKRCDELIWVKTNQLQRLIRTGRTGHWINHGKEHCLVGIKGNPIGINRRLDCDVLVAEVRDTSHKPDEIYGLIERLSPGTRKLELFGRVHNLQPNWVTLGNQLDGVHLAEYDVIDKFKKKYPDGKVTKCE